MSDTGSKVILAFGLLNETVPASSAFHGIPHPVTIVADGQGVVKSKYFEEDYRERQTLAGLLAKEHGVAPAAARAAPAAKHVKLVTAASTSIVRPGQRILLAVEIEIPKGFHLYAPGVEGYHAVDWKMAESPAYRAHAVSYPGSRVLYLEAIKEKVPVYEGMLRLTRDLTAGEDKNVKPLLSPNREWKLEGTLKYQACNDRLCYPPETVPLAWTLEVEGHDRERVPVELQHKPGGR